MATTASVDDDAVLDELDVRALTQFLTVLEDVGLAKGAPDLYVVVSESGSEYLVDADSGACNCPDQLWRDRHCKHARRVEFATGRRPIPEWADASAIDSQLGDHIDASPDWQGDQP